MSTLDIQPFYRKHCVELLGKPARKTSEEKQGLITSPPKLSYDQAMHAWFVYDGQPYHVEVCSHETFTAYIESVTPHSWSAAKRHALIALWPYPETERALSRWYTLDALVTKRVPGLHLFASLQEAEQAAQAEQRAG